MNYKEHTRLDLVAGGNVFKQGDHMTLGFTPRDYEGDVVDLTGKDIEGVIYSRRKGIMFTAPADYVTAEQKIEFTIDEVLDHGEFQIEFTVTDATDPEYRRKFPSAEQDGRLIIKPSADNMDVVGVQMTTVSQLKNELQGLQSDFESSIVPQVDELKQRVDDGVGAFTEDTEVLDARMGEPNLRAFNERVTAQLADKATKGEIAVYDIDKNKGKFDQTYMSDELLQQMAGNTPVNAIPENNSLTTGKFVNKSVTEKKVSFLAQGANLFDKDGDFIDNGYYSPSGIWTTSTNFITYLINVEPGKSYASNVPSSHISYFDADMNNLGGQSINTWTTMDAPSDPSVYYAAVAVTKTADKSGYMIVEGTTLPAEYIPYEFKLKDSIMLSERAKEGLLTPEDLTITNITNNLFDKDGVIVGKEVYNDARFVTQSDSAVTGYVNVQGLSNIYVSGFPIYAAGYSPRNGFFYDENKSPIGSLVTMTRSISEKGFLVPEGAHYFALTIYQRKTSAEVVDFGTIQIEEGTAKTPYEPYSVGVTEINGSKIGVKGTAISNEPVSPLKGKKWAVLGDSVTAGSGTSNPYHQVIANRTGILPVNYGVSGSNISIIDGRTDSFVERYSNMANDADIITVFGGTNDAGNSVPVGAWGDTASTTLYGSVKNLIEGLLSKYPSKRIGFILPLPRTAYPGLENGLVTRIKVIKEVCDRYSIPTLDLYTASGIAPHYLPSKEANMPDGLHPNDAGHQVISHKIEDFLNRI